VGGRLYRDKFLSPRLECELFFVTFCIMDELTGLYNRTVRN